MALANPYTIAHGKYKGHKRLSFNLATATSHTVIAAVSGKRLRIVRAVITIEGDTTSATFGETGDASAMYGPVEVLAATTGAVIQIDQADGLETPTAGTAFLCTLTNTQPISGTIIYTEIN